MMKKAKNLLALFLTIVIVLGMFPTTVLAIGTDDYVYLSISFDGKYINDKNNKPIVYVPVSLKDIASVDLKAYSLENMLYDGNKDGKYDTTALQLIIYAHETLYGGRWADVEFDAIPGSSYFKNGVFGFTENLVYFLNGDFPLKADQTDPNMKTGATSDEIVLKAGDFLDIASFECFSFLWDQAGGFHLFADQNGNYIHDYTAKTGEALPVKLMHSFCDLMYGEAWVQSAANYKIYYGAGFGKADGTVTTDSTGNAQITFPNAGTYYIWCEGDKGSTDGTHASCEYYLETGKPCIVSSPAFATVTVADTQAATPTDQPQDVSAILNATMAQLAATVTAPSFGTNAGEWTVFSLARGNYFTANSQYFADYYERIVETVNATAAKVDLNGALDKNKSTENSRLIMALSAIGKDATSVGDWDLVEAYSENGINWIKKQGMNGTIWTLIALDCGNYATSDTTIRQQCIDSILSLQHNDGGWSLIVSKTQPSNVDITGMALTALYPYRDQPEVKAACEKAISWLSEAQLETGGFPYGKGETSESCAWAIVSLTTWGINPDTDPRFIKNGKSAVDNLLTYYIEDERMFAHQGTESNNMATDQACYALVAYDRFIKGKPSLYDYSDVNAGTEAPDPNEMTATLGLPKNVNAGAAFGGVIGVDKWNNEAGYKLIDFIVNVPKGVSVTDVTASDRLSGGEVVWNLEEDTGKLRVVYFDANENKSLTITGEEFPAELFAISFKAPAGAGGKKLDISLSGMSAKLHADSSDEKSMAVINTSDAKCVVNVVAGITFSAVCLYEGDDVDLIPSTKKAVAVAITGIAKGSKLTFKDEETEIVFQYNQAVSDKTGVSTYVALVDAAIDMAKFIDDKKFTIGAVSEEDSITFGDVNGDGEINAQDALSVVDTWLRKGEDPSDLMILAMNVNGDSRINTYDALGIVEAFVNGTEYGVVTKAATISEKQ